MWNPTLKGGIQMLCEIQMLPVAHGNALCAYGQITPRGGGVQKSGAQCGMFWCHTLSVNPNIDPIDCQGSGYVSGVQ